MGTNSPYFPDNVNCDEEAIVYMGSMIAALKNQTYTAKTGSPVTLTATEMVGGVVEFSGGTTSTITTADADDIIARMQALDANATVGSTATFGLINGNSGTMTVTAGADVTLVGAGSASILTTIARRYQIKILTATTVSLTVVA